MVYESITRLNLNKTFDLMSLSLITVISGQCSAATWCHKWSEPITNPPISPEDNAAKVGARPVPRIAEDEFHARLLPANCMPLSIKFISLLTKARKLRYFLTDFFFSFFKASHAATLTSSFAPGSWQQKVSPAQKHPFRAMMTEIKWAICLHARTRRLHL